MIGCALYGEIWPLLPPDANQSAEHPAAERARLVIDNQLQRLLPSHSERLASKLRAACRRWLDKLVRRTPRDLPRRPDSQFQDRLLADLAAQDKFESAIRLLLRRLIPNPQLAFAAVVESAEIDDQPIRSRALCEDSRRTLVVGDDLREELTFQPSLILAGRELRDHAIFQNLAIEDRRKVEQLYLLRLGDACGEFDVLITSALFPIDLSASENLKFTENVVAMLSELWTANRASRTRRAKQESDKAFAALRIQLKPCNDNPGQIIAQYIGQLQKQLDVDRVSLLVTRGAMSTTRLAVSGPAMPRGIETEWRRHEDTLAAACIDQGCLIRFDMSALRSLAIDTLVGGAVTAPIMIDNRVGAVLCLTSRNGWPIPVRVQRLVRGCAECIQEALVELRTSGEVSQRESSPTVIAPLKLTGTSQQVENQSIEAKSEFLATMSYETRNPGHDFWSMSQADFDTDLTETTHRLTEPNSSGDNSLITLVDDIQDGCESARGWHVLLVDDDPMSRLIGREILQKHGHGVTVVHAGADAVLTVQQQEFDLVLLDLNMPEVDGYSAARQIRRWEQTVGRRTRLIALTGDYGKVERAACREADMDGCLAKPLDMQRLRTTIADLSESKPTTQCLL